MEFFSFLLILIIFIIFLLLVKNFFNGPFTKVISTENLKDKVIIITGSSSGIGKETAFSLLEKGAKVIFACRDENKTISLLNKITNLKMKSNSHFIKLDLSDFSSIDTFVNDFKFQFKNVDYLINNAGVNFDEFSQINGIEATMLINHIGPFYLTNKLLNSFNPEGRIINLSSHGYTLCKEKYLYDWIEQKFDEKNYSFISTYCLSKLCNLFHVKYLNEFFINNQMDLKAVAVHPGLTRSGLFRNYKSFFMRILINILWPIMFFTTKTSLAGAQTTLHCIYLPYERLISGGYYEKCRLKKIEKIGNNEKYMRIVIQETLRIINNMTK